MSVRRFAVLPAVLVAAVVATELPAQAELIDRQFHETFAVEDGDQLFLNFGDGDVRITPWDRSIVDVEVRYRAEYRRVGLGTKKKGDFHVEFRRDGNVIKVVGHEPNYGGVFIGASTVRRYEYVYEVRAPAALPLELVGDDGDVQVRDWQARIALNSEDGDARLERVAEVDARMDDGDLTIAGQTGPMRLRVEDGDISVTGCDTDADAEVDDGEIRFEECSGRFRMVAEDGDIRLHNVNAAHVAVRSEDGDTHLGLVSVGPLEVDVRTQDGDVDLDLAATVSAQFWIETDDGGVRVEAPGVTELAKQRGSTQGVLGDGSGSIRVSSQDGHVTLRQHS